MSAFHELIDLKKLPKHIRWMHRINLFCLTNFRDKIYQNLSNNGYCAGLFNKYQPTFAWHVYFHFLSIFLILFEIPVILYFGKHIKIQNSVIDYFSKKKIFKYTEFQILFGFFLFMWIFLSGLLVSILLVIGSSQFQHSTHIWYTLLFVVVFLFILLFTWGSLSFGIFAVEFFMKKIPSSEVFFNYEKFKVPFKLIYNHFQLFVNKAIDEKSNIIERSLSSGCSFTSKKLDQIDSFYNLKLNIGNSMMAQTQSLQLKTRLDLFGTITVLFIKSYVLLYRGVLTISLYPQQKIMKKAYNSNLFKNYPLLSYLLLTVIVLLNSAIPVFMLLMSVLFIRDNEHLINNSPFYFKFLLLINAFFVFAVICEYVSSINYFVNYMITTFKNSFTFDRNGIIYLRAQKFLRHFRRDVEEDFYNDNLNFLNSSEFL